MEDSARRIAVIAGKGGVGKTTTVINLATAFAEQGCRVLAVDCDPQANLTFGLGFDTYEPRATISEVLCGEVRVTDAVAATPVANLDLLPANTDLISVEARLSTSLGRELLLRKAFAADRTGDRYDYVVFDTPPSFGYHTIIALAAAQGVIVPLQMSGFALQGLREVIRVLSVARRSLNPSLQLLGTVPTFVDRRTCFSRDVLDGLGDVEGLRVFESCISRSVRIQETSLVGMPVLSHAPSSPSAAQFRALAREVADVIAAAPTGAAVAKDVPTPEVVVVGTPVRPEPATDAAQQTLVGEQRVAAVLAGPAVALLERPPVARERALSAHLVARPLTGSSTPPTPRAPLRGPIGGRAHQPKRRWFGLRRAR